MLVAVVVPHAENTKKWAELNGHTGSFSELCLLEQLHTHVLLELKSIALRNKASFSVIKITLSLFLFFWLCKRLKLTHPPTLTTKCPNQLSNSQGLNPNFTRLECLVPVSKFIFLFRCFPAFEITPTTPTRFSVQCHLLTRGLWTVSSTELT